MKRKKILKKFAKELNIKLRAFIANDKGSRFLFLSPEKQKELQEKKRFLAEEAKKQVGEAEQQVAQSRTKKSKFSKLIFFVINIIIVGLILYFQISNEGTISIVELLAFRLNYWFLVAALLTFALMMFLKSLRFNLLIKRGTNRSRPFLSYKVASLGRYYDCITPMAAGGQPFQVFYLNRRGLDAPTALSVPLSKFFITQLAWIIVNVFAVWYSLRNGTMGSSNIVLVVALTSFTLNFLMVTTLLISSISGKFAKLVTIKVLKLLERIKLLKNYDKQYNKVMKTIDDYQESIKTFLKNLPLFLFLLVLSIIIVIINYSIPFFIYSALVGFNLSAYLDVMVIAIMIEIAAGMIPLPGGTGMNEISFTALFASFFNNGTLFWALLAWRIMNYYSYIIQGMLIVFYDYLIGNKKYLWQKKKWELEGESIEFKNKQLEEYRKKKRRKKVKRLAN